VRLNSHSLAQFSAIGWVVSSVPRKLLGLGYGVGFPPLGTYCLAHPVNLILPVSGAVEKAVTES
jgi:hypothetical protein